MKARVRAQRSDHLRGEAAWIPRTMDELEQVRRVLTDAGHSNAVVNGVTGWLVAKSLGEEDATNSVTRSKYRKVLAELESPLDDEPKRSDRSHRVGAQPPIIIAPRVMSGAGGHRAQAA